MENNNQNLTIWQKLSKTFGPNSLLNQDYPTYSLDKKELLKTTDKQEYEREKYELVNANEIKPKTVPHELVY